MRRVLTGSAVHTASLLYVPTNTSIVAAGNLSDNTCAHAHAHWSLMEACPICKTALVISMVSHSFPLIEQKHAYSMNQSDLNLVR